MGSLLLIAAGVMLVDAASKHLSLKLLANSGTVSLLGGLIELKVMYNDGIALGLLGGNKLAIIILPLAIMAAGYFLMRRYIMTPFKSIAIALVLGGFLGNFIERVIRGYVLDMIYFSFLPWFVCNIADIAICAGVVMLGISLFFRPEDWREKNANDKANRSE